MMLFSLLLFISFFGSCNMWAYKGSTFDTSVYEQTYFEIDSSIAYFPENISNKYNVFCYCNGEPKSFKGTDSTNIYSYKFPVKAFDSCKNNEIHIIFSRKNDLKKRYEFFIYPVRWSDTERKVRGLIYAKPGSINGH